MTRFNGTVIITEGQTFTERHEEYMAISEAPLFFEDHRFFSLRLDRVSPTFEKGALTELAGYVTLIDDGRTSQHAIRVNHPLVHKKTGFLIHGYGFAPFLVFKNNAGTPLIRSYVKLSSEGGRNEDYIAVPGSDMFINARLYPDAEPAGGGLKVKSNELKAPVIEIRVERKLEDGAIKERLFRGYLKPGESAGFGRGLNLTFVDVRYWVQFNVGKDRGKPVIFFGFWLGVLGITVRFVADVISRPLNGRPGETSDRGGEIERAAV